MFSGLMKSVKGFLGYENLEVEGGVEGQDHNIKEEERQGLWRQLSSFIGKDVTSMISLPIWIFEPVSFLQIMAEPLQYSDLLLQAGEIEDPAMRMALIMAFITAGYSCAVRNKKPFNPILGETFEFIPEDKKWKFIAEQVSHHPPIGVAQAICDAFILRLEMELKTKFRGNSSDVMVLGSNSIEFPKFGEYYDWGHLESCAHNIIIGGMWVDHFGSLEVNNRTSGYKGVLKFNKSGWLGAGRFELSGEIYDKEGKLKMKVLGKWNDFVSAIPVTETGKEQSPITLWRKTSKPGNNKWNLSDFVMHLNSFDKQYEAILPPNDSRLRGDRLYLEKDDIETAGKEKIRLEEKQRAERKEREEKGETWEPKIFKSVEDPVWGHKYVYVGKYWEEREERIKNSTHEKTAESSETPVQKTDEELAAKTETLNL